MTKTTECPYCHAKIRRFEVSPSKETCPNCGAATPQPNNQAQACETNSNEAKVSRMMFDAELAVIQETFAKATEAAQELATRTARLPELPVRYHRDTELTGMLEAALYELSMALNNVLADPAPQSEEKTILVQCSVQDAASKVYLGGDEASEAEIRTFLHEQAIAEEPEWDGDGESFEADAGCWQIPMTPKQIRKLEAEGSIELKGAGLIITAEMS